MNRVFVFGLSLSRSVPAFALVAGGCGTACIAAGATQEPFDLSAYLWRQFAVIAVFYLAGYVLGKLVQRQSISASLSRKFICLVTFAVSFANSLSVSAHGTLLTCVMVAGGCGVVLLMLGSLALPFRSKVPALNCVFAAINRPEDEPYTLRWLATEAIATSVIIMAFVPVIAHFLQNYVSNGEIFYGVMLMPIFASGIGDALAEIVGKKCGRHHYTTRAVFGNRTYTRSLEGSAMVFLTTIAVGLCVAWHFSFLLPLFFWKAFILLPFTLTLAEAKAPHTWDNPIMYVVGYATIILCLL